MWSFFKFTLSAVLLLLCLQNEAQIIVNEFLASNATVIEDPDFNENTDWIELRNETNTAQNIGGFYLTDNISDTLKWQIPMGTQIEANGYLLVWADGMDNGLHSNFKLSKDLEEIGLYNGSLELIDEHTFDCQATDVSMGRAASGEWRYYLEPTPGSSNSTTSYADFTHYPVFFSLAGGFYDAAISVELSAKEGQIRYTLDGSEPNASSALYTEPILISEHQAIRAAAFLDDHIPGPIMTNTFFIGDELKERVLPVVSISTAPDNFWDAETGLYVQDFKPDWQYPINVEFFESDGRQGFSEKAAIKVVGQNSWQLPQKALRIYFDNEFGSGTLDYPLFYDHDRTTFKNFTLRCSGNDWSHTLFRDAFIQSLSQPDMDVDIMGYRPCIVYVNGQYMGIHNIRSRADEWFPQENYGYDKDQVDVIENNGDVVSGSDDRFDELFELLEEDLSIQENFEAVAAVMDLENFTDYLILEIYCDNTSWDHNIFCWHPGTDDGKWRWFIVDTDRGLNSQDEGIDAYTDTDDENPYFATLPGQQLLENDTYRAYFIERFNTLLNTTLHPSRVIQHLDLFRDNIKDEVPYHLDRWEGTTSNYGDAIESYDQWLRNVDRRKSAIVSRHNFLLSDLDNLFELEGAATLSISSNNNDAGSIVYNAIELEKSTWSTDVLLGQNIELEAKANGGYQFDGWFMGTSERLIDSEDEWKYLPYGSAFDSNWMMPSFNDDNWSSGISPLGYGDSEVNTTLEFGNDSGNKPAANYFRKKFTVDADITTLTGAILKLRRDDGVIVYLDGVEVLRDGLLPGPVGPDDTATYLISSNNEDTFRQVELDAALFTAGEHTIAVETHQFATLSSDVFMDLRLELLGMDNSQLLAASPILNIDFSESREVVATFSKSSTCILPPTIETDRVLTKDCSPYFVNKDLLIEQGVSMRIEAGVELHMAEQSSLRVEGQLLVYGTESEPVVFRANEQSDSWGNLYFYRANAPSSLNHLHVIDASSGYDHFRENAAIASYDSELDISHLTALQNFSNPIYIEGGEFNISHSNIHSDVTGDLINVKYGKTSISHSNFYGNDQVDTDAIDLDGVYDSSVSNCTIQDLFGFNSDGIDLGEGSKSLVISNVFINSCSDKGVSVGQKSEAEISNCVITGCTQGFGLKDECQVSIIGNTLYGNTTAVAAFQKNKGFGGGNAEISNNIISNSYLDALFIDEYSNVLSANNNVVDTDNIETEINADPNFENPSFFDFTQTDFPGTGSTISVWAEPEPMISEIHYNPFAGDDYEFLEIFNPHNESIDLSGYYFSKGVEFVFPDGTMLDGGDYLTIAKNPALITNAEGQVYQWLSGSLNNSGEGLQLNSAYNMALDYVRYRDIEPWPVDADGFGNSLELKSPNLDNHFGYNWRNSETLGGTPGTGSFLVSSIDDTDFTSISISPNPARMNLQVEVSESGHLSLFNTQGVLLKVFELESGTNTIDLPSDLSATLYLLQWTDGETHKLLIQNR